MLSGSVLDPSALRDLIPDFVAKGAPLAAEVRHDDVYFLTSGGKLRFPLTPPPLRNHGNYVISLNKFVKWLAQQVEGRRRRHLHRFCRRRDALRRVERRLASGPATGASTNTATGSPPTSPGPDIRAKVTILCDGVRGNLTKTLVRKLKLDEGRLPQVYAIGIKELWELPADRMTAGSVMHTMGYPLRMEEFGGAFVYALPERHVVRRIRHRARLPRPDVRSAPHVPALQAASADGGSARRREDGAVRREGAAGRRVAHDSACARRWRADRGRRGRIHELDAPQGHPPRDAHGDAGRGDGVRGRARRRHVRREPVDIPGAHRREPGAQGAVPCPQRPSGVRARPDRWPGVRRACRW